MEHSRGRLKCRERAPKNGLAEDMESGGYSERKRGKAAGRKAPGVGIMKSKRREKTEEAIKKNKKWGGLGVEDGETENFLGVLGK